MTRVDEFDAFYDGTRRHVLHLAYAFTGDLPAAAAATQDAYASAWQHWPKLRGGEPLEVVRPESLRVAALRHNAHLVRRKPPPEADTELISALRALSSTARRLVILQTIGHLDLGRAAREVGVTDDDAIRITDATVASLEESLGTPIGVIERRLHAMHALADAAPLPRATIIRRTGGRRHRRNTAVAVAASAALLLGGGYLVTATPQTAAAPRPEASSPTTPPAPAPSLPRGPTVEEDQLLTPLSLNDLSRVLSWQQLTTSQDLSNQRPLTPCAAARFASPRLRTGFTRTFRGDQLRSETAVQTVELTRSADAAKRAYESHLDWYSGCQESRVQLMRSYEVNRRESDIRILVLRRWADPGYTMTVGVARTGAAATTVVHRVQGDAGVRIQTFAEVMDSALGRLCLTTRGVCQINDKAVVAPPPSTGEGTGFLGVVDLPPVADLAKVWGGTEPLPWRPEPPATPCDVADFSQGAELARSRDYVVPGAEQIPLTFGISETVARFASPGAAREFADRAATAVLACDEENLAADVSDGASVRQGAVTATHWLMAFSLADDAEATYRLGVVVNRDRVAQVVFSPVGRYELDEAAFERLLVRAGQRLAELPAG